MPLAAILHNKFTAFILLEDFSLEIFKSSSTLCSLNEYNIVNTAFLTALGHAPIPLYLPFKAVGLEIPPYKYSVKAFIFSIPITFAASLA